MHGSFVEEAYRSAQAWIGLYDWARIGSPDYYDHRVWERRSDVGPVVGQDDAVLVRSGDGVDVYEVRRTEPIMSNLMGNYPDKEPKDFYPQIDKRTADRTFHLLVFLFGDPDERDLRKVLGEPPVDGYLAGLFVLADADRFLPLSMVWRGRQLDRSELGRRAALALSSLPGQVRPKVPAPVLPADVVADMVRIRKVGGSIGREERRRFVERLLVLDRTSFLEVLGRMIPWIDEGEVGWLDKDDEVADRLWQILGESPELAPKMRLSPWKTGLGEPKSLRRRVLQDTSGPLSYHDRIVDLTREPDGSYRVVGR